jgi:hypothetical protein
MKLSGCARNPCRITGTSERLEMLTPMRSIPMSAGKLLVCKKAQAGCLSQTWAEELWYDWYGSDVRKKIKTSKIPNDRQKNSSNKHEEFMRLLRNVQIQGIRRQPERGVLSSTPQRRLTMITQ